MLVTQLWGPREVAQTMPGTPPHRAGEGAEKKRLWHGRHGRGRYSEAIGMRLGRSAMYRIRIILLKPVLRCALVISRALGLRSHRRAEKRITCWQSRLDR